MITHFVIGVKDGDPKGLSGRGTLFYALVRENGSTIEQEYLWSIMDELQETEPYLKIKELRAQYLEDKIAIAEQHESDIKAARDAEDRLRLQATLSPEVHDIISRSLSDNKALVEKAKAGHGKTINALMGRTMMLLREANLSVDPMVLTHHLKISIDATV